MSKQHAILSPSGASRWLVCTPSARLEQQFPSTSSGAADEGTLAHELGELMIAFKAKQINRITYNKKLADIQANEPYSEDMYDYMEDYSAYVIEQYAAAQKHTRDALLFLETKIDLTKWVPEGFGTGDVFIIADECLYFIDLKYGKGVPVSAVENKQMMLYALGAWEQFSHIYDIKRVSMTIYQPRLDSITDFEMEVEDLLRWAEEDLKPKARLAYDGEGEFAPGDACRFCRAKALCKANADYHLQLAVHDFKSPELLTAEEVADILTRADNFIKWINAVSEHALAEALNGKEWPGFKLVEGRSVRKYTDTDSILKVLTTEAKYQPEQVTEPAKLLGITALEKVIGKSDFENHVSPYVIKPQGKPTLVPASDKRPMWNGAAQDFKQIVETEFQ